MEQEAGAVEGHRALVVGPPVAPLVAPAVIRAQVMEEAVVVETPTRVETLEAHTSMSTGTPQ